MIFPFPLFLLLNPGLLHDHPLGPKQNTARGPNEVLSLKETSAGPRRNFPRQIFYEFRCFVTFSLSPRSFIPQAAPIDDASVAI